MKLHLEDPSVTYTQLRTVAVDVLEFEECENFGEEEDLIYRCMEFDVPRMSGAVVG